MRLILIFLFVLNIYANENNIKTIKADFIQTITDEKKVKIKYSGELIAKKENYLLWNYNFPVKKLIYINKNKIFIIEPELEQVIIKKYNRKELNYFEILKNKIHIKNNKFKIIIDKTIYYLTLKNNLIKNISYKDEMGNSVLIIFSNYKINEKINNKEFTPNIPKYYDIIN